MLYYHQRYKPARVITYTRSARSTTYRCRINGKGREMPDLKYGVVEVRACVLRLGMVRLKATEK